MPDPIDPYEEEDPLDDLLERRRRAIYDPYGRDSTPSNPLEKIKQQAEREIRQQSGATPSRTPSRTSQPDTLQDDAQSRMRGDTPYLPTRGEPGTPQTGFDEDKQQRFLDDGPSATFAERAEVAVGASGRDTPVITQETVEKAEEGSWLHHVGIIEPIDYIRRYGWQAVVGPGSLLPDTDRDDALGQASRLAQELVGIYGDGIPAASDARDFQTDSDLIHYVLNPLITSDVDGLMTATGKSLVDSASAVYESWQDGTISNGDAYREMAEIMESASSPTALLRRPGEGFEKSPRRQMRENLYAAVADGELHEKGIENIKLNYYDFARGEADNLVEAPLAFAVTLGGVAPGVPYLMGRDVVDSMLTMEQAKQFAAEATNNKDRLYFEALSTEWGREMIGIGYEILYDPLWFAGPAKGVQTIHKGGQSLALSADATRAARALHAQGLLELDDAMRIVAGLASKNAEEVTESREVLAGFAKTLRAQEAQSLSEATRKARVVGEENLKVATAGRSAPAPGSTAARVAQQRIALQRELDDAIAAVEDINSNLGQPGKRTAELNAALREMEVKKTALAREGNIHGLINSGRADLMVYKKARRMAGEIETVLRRADSPGELSDLVKEAGRFAYVNPLTGKTEYLSQLPGVQPVVRSLGASTSAATEPYRLTALIKKIDEIKAARGFTDDAEAISELPRGQQLALYAHQNTALLNDIKGATWNLLRQVIGTRHLQPRFAEVRDSVQQMHLVKKGRLAARDLKGRLSQRFAFLGRRYVKMREVNPKIWSNYDKAVDNYFLSMEARKGSLMQAQRRYMLEAKRILATRKARARSGDPEAEQWASPDYGIQNVLDEAADAIGTGAGTLKDRPELWPLIKKMDDLVQDFARDPDVAATVEEVRQALISIARFAKGDPDMIRMHQQELDLLEDAAGEAVALQKVRILIAKLQKETASYDIRLARDEAIVELRQWAEQAQSAVAQAAKGEGFNPAFVSSLIDAGNKDLVDALNKVYDAAKTLEGEPTRKAAREAAQKFRTAFNKEQKNTQKRISQAEETLRSSWQTRVEEAKASRKLIEARKDSTLEAARKQAKTDYHGENGQKHRYAAQAAAALAAEAKVKKLEDIIYNYDVVGAKYYPDDKATYEKALEAARIVADQERALARTLKSEKAFVASRVKEARAKINAEINAAKSDVDAQREAKNAAMKAFAESQGKIRDEIEVFKKDFLEKFDGMTEKLLDDLRTRRAAAKAAKAEAKDRAVGMTRTGAAIQDLQAQARAALQAAESAAFAKIQSAKEVAGQPAKVAARARELRRAIVEAQPRLEPPSNVDGVLPGTLQSRGREDRFLIGRQQELRRLRDAAQQAGDADLVKVYETRLARIDAQFQTNARQRKIQQDLAQDIEDLKALKKEVRADKSLDEKQIQARIDEINVEMDNVRFVQKEAAGQRFILEQWEIDLWSRWRTLTGSQAVRTNRGITPQALKLLTAAESAARTKMDKFADQVKGTNLSKATPDERRKLLDEAQALRRDYQTARNARRDASEFTKTDVELDVAYSPEEMLLATFAVLRETQGTKLLTDLRTNPMLRDISQQYPQFVTQRLGDLPDDMVPLVSEMSRIFKSYEKLYQEHGMKFVKNPVDMMQDWGVINYVPHVTTTETVAQLTGMASATFRGRDGRGVARALDTLSDANKKRTLAGTIAEINAATSMPNVMMQIDPTAITSRYLQANRALSASDMMEALLQGGVIRVIEPTDGKTISQVAFEEDLVPLFEQGGAKQQQMRDLIDALLDNPQAALRNLREDPEQYTRLKRLADALNEAKPADRQPLATMVVESKKHARAAVVEQMYAFLRAKELLQPAETAVQKADRLGTALSDISELKQLRVIGPSVEPTDLNAVHRMFMQDGTMSADQAWDKTAELFNESVRKYGMNVATEGRFLKEYFEGSNKLNRMYIPRAVHQSLEEMFDNQFTGPLKEFWNGGLIRQGIRDTWSWANNFFKTRATVIATAFHTTNFMGNKLSEMMDIGVGGALSLRTNAMSNALAAMAVYMDRYGSLEAADKALRATKQADEADLYSRLTLTAQRRRIGSSALFNGHLALLRAVTGNSGIWRKADPLETFDLGDGVPRTIDEMFSVLRDNNVVARDYQQYVDLDTFADDMADLLDQKNFTASGFDALRLSHGRWKKKLSKLEDVILVGVGNTIAGGLPVVIPKTFGAGVGRRVENISRVNNFVANLRRGKTVEEAAASVQKFLFNYSDLTEVQRTMMRGVMPFFTWTQKNMRLQIDQLYTNPSYAATYHKMLVQGLPRVAYAYTEEKIVEDRSAKKFVVQPNFNSPTHIRGFPDYAKPKVKFRIGEDQYILGLRTPIEGSIELAGMLGSLAAFPGAVYSTLRGGEEAQLMDRLGKGGVSNSLRLLSQSHILLRMAAELVTQRSIYYGTPIEDMGNAETAYALYLGLKEMGLSGAAETWRTASDLSVNARPTGRVDPKADVRVNYLLQSGPYARAVNEVVAATSLVQHSVTRDPELYNAATQADVRTSAWAAADAVFALSVKAHNPQQQREVQQYLLEKAQRSYLESHGYLKQKTRDQVLE